MANDNEIIIVDEKVLQSKIYIVRGQQVMLDSDLAEIYGYETKNFNRQVKNNIERFEGDDFMFEVTKEELLRCQIGTLKKGRGEHHKYLPFAFTELGVAMLSSVLRSEKAIKTNRDIMRAFVEFRHIAATLPDTQADVARLRKDFEELKQDIEDILRDQNDINESTRMQLDSISLALAELQPREPRKPRRRIGFVQEDNNEKE